MFCNRCGNSLAPNESVCSRCGNSVNVQLSRQNNQNILNGPQNSFNNTYVNNQNYNNVQSESMSNIKMVFIGIGIGIGLIILGVIITNFMGIPANKYFFDFDFNEQNDEVVQSSEKTTKKGKYGTVIIYDNTYSGVKISNNKDAIALIEKDSVSQKNNCPSKIKRVEDEIINEYNITAVNLCEMDVDFARELGNVFKKIYNEYPSIRGYITNLSLANVSMSSDYIAAFMPIFNFATADSSSTHPWVIKTQVLLNTSYFLNKEKLEASVVAGAESNHFPKNASIYSPVAHELGHYLSFLAMMKHYKIDSILLVYADDLSAFYNLYNDFGSGTYSLEMINEAFENYKRDTNSTLTLDEWRGTISNYALAKNNNGGYIYDETIAESFHDVYLNGNKASEASKYIISVLKNRLGS